MAIAVANELHSVVDVTKRLRALLEHARDVKPSTSVDPPLPVSEFTDQVNALHEGFEKHYDQNYKYAVVETAARELFSSLITSAEIEDPAFVEVWNLLDILLICSDKGKCTPELACWLVEELLDSQTTHGCRVVFDYLELRRERLAQKDFHKKNLVFLRSCNELLRRLSRAEDAIFCGRVFFFLFQTFPLGDKSSVNLRGEFHVENTTKFEASEADGDQNGSQMEVDSGIETGSETPKASTPQPPTKPGSKAIPVKAPPKKEEEVVLTDSQLYPIFWRLQQDFSDPTRLFGTGNFNIFKKGVDRTITKFKKTSTVVQTQTTNAKRGTKRKIGDDSTMGSGDVIDDQLLDNYNPKYLTSRDLFDLELSDLAFQRHILVQALILIDFLLSLTEKAKKKLAALDSTNKSMLYSFTLSEDDAKWAATTRQSITNYLSASAEGRLFNRMVETVLARDKNWIRWKVESCPSIVRGPVSTQSEMDARKGVRDVTRVRRLPEKPPNSMDLSFLDEGVGGELDALKDRSRYTLPPVDELLDGIKTEELDLEMAMDEQETASLQNAIANKRWRILRQTRADRLKLLDKVEPEKDLDAVFQPPPLSQEESRPVVDVEDDHEVVVEDATRPEDIDQTVTSDAPDPDGDEQSAVDNTPHPADVDSMETEPALTMNGAEHEPDVQMTSENQSADGSGGDSERQSATVPDANQGMDVE